MFKIGNVNEASFVKKKKEEEEEKKKKLEYKFLYNIKTIDLNCQHY